MYETSGDLPRCAFVETLNVAFSSSTGAALSCQLAPAAVLWLRGLNANDNNNNNNGRWQGLVRKEEIQQ